VKKISLFIILLFCAYCCFAQDVVNGKEKLTSLVNVTYQTVIQTNKQVKQGVYRAFYKKKTLIAMGTYTNDKRTGTWHFFDRAGKQLENYNYDINKLTYEAPEDSVSNFSYVIDNKITGADRVTKPVRPGGRYFGYVPYLKVFKITPEMAEEDRGFDVILELLISPGGRLADYNIHIRNFNSDKDLEVLSVNTDLIPEEDKVFLPATFNNQPVSSRIMIHCFTTRTNDIDMY
jgi:hypothetical protein